MVKSTLDNKGRPFVKKPYNTHPFYDALHYKIEHINKSAVFFNVTTKKTMGWVQIDLGPKQLKPVYEFSTPNNKLSERIGYYCE